MSLQSIWEHGVPLVPRSDLTFADVDERTVWGLMGPTWDDSCGEGCYCFLFLHHLEV